jgi:hypothetical protein
VATLVNSDTCPRPTAHQVAQALDVVRVLAVDVLVDLRRVDCEIAADRAMRSSLLVSYAVIFSNICNLSSAICLKRGSVQPGCIRGGLRFRSTTIRFFKFVWYF